MSTCLQWYIWSEMTQFWFYSQRVEIFVRLVRGVAPAPSSQLCSVRQFPQSEWGEGGHNNKVCIWSSLMHCYLKAKSLSSGVCTLGLKSTCPKNCFT